MITSSTTTPVPVSVDIHKVCRAEAAVSGSIAVSGLQRFSACLSDSSGEVAVALRFYTDENWRRRIDGQISTTVNVNCQRCLQPLPITIDEQLHLAVVETEALAQRLPAGIDAWISEEQRLLLHDIIEEQLILGVPFVSRHADDDCRMYRDGNIADPQHDASTAQETVKDKPFAVLARLKENNMSGNSGSDPES